MSELTILVAHGSSDPNWSNTFVALTAPTREQHTNARLAFMELSEPSIEDVVAEGVGEGVRHFNVLPLFLARGRHLKTDIPNILAGLETKYAITTDLMPPIGEHTELADAINRIIHEAMH